MTRAPASIQLTVSLPVLDECATLEEVVQKSLAALDERAEHDGLTGEVLIVNDGSTDGSAAIADELARRHERVRVVHHAKPTGYAEVQRACYREARGEWVLLIPADGQVDPSVLGALWRHSPEAELVVGIPDLPSAQRRPSSRLYHLLGALLFGRRPWWGLGPCLLVRRATVEACALQSSTPVLMTELALRIEANEGRIRTEAVAVGPRRAGRSARRSLYPSIGRIGKELITLRLGASLPRAAHTRTPEAAP